MNDVGTMSWNGHNLDAAAQYVLIIIDMTLVRVNDKPISSIQHFISLQEENKPEISANGSISFESTLDLNYYDVNSKSILILINTMLLVEDVVVLQGPRSDVKLFQDINELGKPLVYICRACCHGIGY